MSRKRQPAAKCLTLARRSHPAFERENAWCRQCEESPPSFWYTASHVPSQLKSRSEVSEERRGDWYRE
jgi:hypothetical protein